jgi:hypothetical protein
MTQPLAREPPDPWRTLGPAELAALLRRGHGPLVARWCQRVRADPGLPEAHHLPMPAMQNHVPALVHRLTEHLARCRGRDGEPIGRALGQTRESTEHARVRFAHGYSLPAVVRELSHLRAAVMDYCAAERTTARPSAWCPPPKPPW